MKISDLKLSKKAIGLWVVSIILCAVSFEGILSFPNLVQSSHSLPQYLITIAHSFYVIAGIIIVIGIWRTLHFTPAIVILWGIGSLASAVGGPLVFGMIQPTFLRTSIVLTIVIFVLTYGLFLFTRNIIKGK